MAEEIKDLPITEEADGSLTVGDKTQPEEVEEAEHEDAKIKASDDGDDEDGHADETSEEAEERRQRNRLRRTQNKENRKTYIESLKRELASRDAVINDLSTRVASVERQGQGSQMAQVDTSIKEAEQYYNHFKQVN